MEFKLRFIDSFSKALRRPNSYAAPDECRRCAVLLPALWSLADRTSYSLAQAGYTRTHTIWLL